MNGDRGIQWKSTTNRYNIIYIYDYICEIVIESFPKKNGSPVWVFIAFCQNRFDLNRVDGSILQYPASVGRSGKSHGCHVGHRRG